MYEEEYIKKILKERAKRISSTNIESISTRDNYISGLLFKLSDEVYVVDTSYVNEVVFIKEVTPLPATPAFLLGIINVRGKIISVIDLRKFFSLSDRGITNLNRVIVIEGNDMEFGILVDEILGNSSVSIDNLQKDITGITEVADNYIKGVCKNNEIVIDILKIINDNKIIVNDII